MTGKDVTVAEIEVSQTTVNNLQIFCTMTDRSQADVVKEALETFFDGHPGVFERARRIVEVHHDGPTVTTAQGVEAEDKGKPGDAWNEPMLTLAQVMGMLGVGDDVVNMLKDRKEILSVMVKGEPYFVYSSVIAYVNGRVERGEGLAVISEIGEEQRRVLGDGCNKATPEPFGWGATKDGDMVEVSAHISWVDNEVSWAKMDLDAEHVIIARCGINALLSRHYESRLSKLMSPELRRQVAELWLSILVRGARVYTDGHRSLFAARTADMINKRLTRLLRQTGFTRKLKLLRSLVDCVSWCVALAIYEPHAWIDYVSVGYTMADSTRHAQISDIDLPDIFRVVGQIRASFEIGGVIVYQESEAPEETEDDASIDNKQQATEAVTVYVKQCTGSGAYISDVHLCKDIVITILKVSKKVVEDNPLLRGFDHADELANRLYRGLSHAIIKQLVADKTDSLDLEGFSSDLVSYLKDYELAPEPDPEDKGYITTTALIELARYIVEG